MKRHFIEEVKHAVTNGGTGCGPVPGQVVVTLKIADGSDAYWLTLVEVDGIPNIYLMDKDLHDALVEEADEDEVLTDYMEGHFISEFDGIELDGDYNTIFQSIEDDQENPAVPLIRYLITLTRCDWDEVDELIAMAAGKYADEIEIPISDVEEDFIEENEDDEDVVDNNE